MMTMLEGWSAIGFVLLALAGMAPILTVVFGFRRMTSAFMVLAIAVMLMTAIAVIASVGIKSGMIGSETPDIDMIFLLKTAMMGFVSGLVCIVLFPVTTRVAKKRGNV